MKSYPEQVKETLDSLIRDMSQFAWLFAKDPQRDFTRSRKLPFEEMIRILLGMGGGNLTKEILDWFACKTETASASAFIQQREKLLPDALEFLFRAFTDSCDESKTYRGYRLLAIDGSDLVFSGAPKDKDTYFRPISDGKGYGMLHLNAMYDLCSHLYQDAIVQGSVIHDELLAMNKMVDRSHISGPVIVLADRGYEAYNTLAHIEQKGWNYIFRVKDSWGGILQGMTLPDSPDFDIHMRLLLTRSRNATMRTLIQEHPNTYRWISSNTRFDFIPHSSRMVYEFNFRIVRVQTLPGKFETLITNLDEAAFPSRELKYLYHLRWGIETSFRNLKHTIGLSHFHAKKPEYVIQEIYSRLTMYNFTEIITSHVVIQSKPNRKHIYKVNFYAAAHICRQYFHCVFSHMEPQSLILKFISPVRPGRSYPRNVKSKAPVSFTYRVI